MHGALPPSYFEYSYYLLTMVFRTVEWSSSVYLLGENISAQDEVEK
jgi:hypothetical protein